MNEQLSGVENKLAEVFKGAPKIPENGRKSIVNAMPWIALIFGVLQVWFGFSMWRNADRYNDLLTGLNEPSRAFGSGTTASSELGVFYWLTTAAVVVSGVLLLLAYPGLKEKKKAGWNWVFYGVLFNLVVGVFAVFVDDTYGGGLGDLVASVVSTAIGLWILFQIRDHYMSKASVPVADK